METILQIICSIIALIIFIWTCITFVPVCVVVIIKCVFTLGVTIYWICFPFFWIHKGFKRLFPGKEKLTYEERVEQRYQRLLAKMRAERRLTGVIYVTKSEADKAIPEDEIAYQESNKHTKMNRLK